MPDGRVNAVVSGTYSDFKIVKTRSVFQMVIEGPIERAAEAVAMFGVPQPGQEIHVAVARLQVPAPSVARKPESAPVSGVNSTGAAPGREHKSEAARERFKQLGEPEQMVARCALICKDSRFWKFAGVASEEQARAFVCSRLDIGRRRDLVANIPAQRQWKQIMTDFDIFTGAQAAP